MNFNSRNLGKMISNFKLIAYKHHHSMSVDRDLCIIFKIQKTYEIITNEMIDRSIFSYVFIEHFINCRITRIPDSSIIIIICLVSMLGVYLLHFC